MTTKQATKITTLSLKLDTLRELAPVEATTVVAGYATGDVDN